jgi:hypothetical protein
MSPIGAHVFEGTRGAVARPSTLNKTSTVAMAAADAVERLKVFMETLPRIIGLSMSRFSPVADSKPHQMR